MNRFDLLLRMKAVAYLNEHHITPTPPGPAYNAIYMSLSNFNYGLGNLGEAPTEFPITLAAEIQAFNGTIALSVSLGDDGRKHLSSSTDLVTWNEADLDGSSIVTGIPYWSPTLKKFFVPSQGCVFASSDGITWDYVQGGDWYTSTFFTLHDSGKVIVALCNPDNNNKYEVYMHNGTKFEKIYETTDQLSGAFAIGDDVYLVYINGTHNIYKLVNGETVEQSGCIIPSDQQTIDFKSNGVVAVNALGTFTPGASPKVTLTLDGAGIVAYKDGKFYGSVAADGSISLRESSDGTTWTPVQGGSNVGLFASNY